MKLQRYADNPILSANPDNDWESLCVCNPAVWYEDGMFTMLYRAAGGDEAHRIHLGLATSADGFHFERQDSRPVLSPTPGNYDGGCVEDPRVVKLNGTFYVTYACRPYPPGRYWEFPPTNQPLCPGVETWGFEDNLTFTALAATRDFRAFRKMGRMTRAGMDDRDVLLFPEKVGGRYVRLSRGKEWVGEAYGCRYPSIWLAYSDQLLEWPDGAAACWRRRGNPGRKSWAPARRPSAPTRAGLCSITRWTRRGFTAWGPWCWIWSIRNGCWAAPVHRFSSRKNSMKPTGITTAASFPPATW